MVLSRSHRIELLNRHTIFSVQSLLPGSEKFLLWLSSPTHLISSTLTATFVFDFFGSQ